LKRKPGNYCAFPLRSIIVKKPQVEMICKDNIAYTRQLMQQKYNTSVLKVIWPLAVCLFSCVMSFLQTVLPTLCYAMLLAVIVCPSVTSGHCTKTAKFMIMQAMPRDSPGTSILMPTVVGGRSLIPREICAQSDPPLFRTQRFRPISAHSTSTMRAGKNVQLALIGS